MVNSGLKEQQGDQIEGVFVGTFSHGMDPKKRLTIPSNWRDQMKDADNTLFIVPGIDEKCLCVFPGKEMTHRLEVVGHHSITDKKARQFSRILASRSELITWDSQGRIRVKDELLEYAGIKDQIVMVGNFRFFEMWNPELLKQSGAMEQANLADAVRHVGF